MAYAIALFLGALTGIGFISAMIMMSEIPLPTRVAVLVVVVCLVCPQLWVYLIKRDRRKRAEEQADYALLMANPIGMSEAEKQRIIKRQKEWNERMGKMLFG